MNTTQAQASVKSWMQKAGQETPAAPRIPDLETRKLRARLILEEALETIRDGLGLEIEVTIQDCGARYVGEIHEFKICEYANSSPNLIELADGMADLQVVNLGTAVACGIDLEPVFQEVMRSNSSKFTWSDDDLREVCQKCGWTIERVEGGFRVKDAGGKIQKPKNYSAANIGPILEAQSL